MPAQVQKERAAPQEKVEATKVEAKDLTNQPLTDAVEDLLDEIDGILEENAEEFVKAYVQEGGQ